jgi:hypothetical protein
LLLSDGLGISEQDARSDGDLLSLPWTACDSSVIPLSQGKTGARVTVPFGEPPKKLLDTAEKRAVTILAEAIAATCRYRDVANATHAGGYGDVSFSDERQAAHCEGANRSLWQPDSRNLIAIKPRLRLPDPN